MRRSPLSATLNRRRLQLLATAALLAATSLHAAPPKAREGTLGGGKAGGPILSVAQLRACMAQQARMQSQEEEAARTRQQLSNEIADIDRAAEALKADLPGVDRTSQEAIDAYKARAAAHDKRVESYEERVPQFNAQVEALNAQRAAFAKSCDGRRYLEDDYKDIKAGK
jgi:chromosome segregation ATPase